MQGGNLDCGTSGSWEEEGEEESFHDAQETMI
jgi:hypothetical protein